MLSAAGLHSAVRYDRPHSATNTGSSTPIRPRIGLFVSLIHNYLAQYYERITKQPNAR